MRIKSFVGAMSACLLSVAGTPVISSVIYTYTGNLYTVATGLYDNSMSVGARIELESELGIDLSGIEVTPVSFRISDGVNTITHSSDAVLARFMFSTDASGSITGWYIRTQAMTTRDNGDLHDTQMTSLHNVVFPSTEDTAITEEVQECANYRLCIPNHVLYSYASTTNAGRWSVAAVPIPVSVWLFGSGLLCLIGAARRKGRV